MTFESHSNPTEEFEQIVEFLRSKLPLHFASGTADPDSFGVGDEFDSDLIASFLMTFDEFTSDVPAVLQRYLRTLKSEWTVIGSFSIHSPFNDDGTVNRRPRFTVTRHRISGELDMQSLQERLGSKLRRRMR